MSIVSVTYARNLGRVEQLTAGQWTDETASGRVALCCARCAAIFDLSELHRVDEAHRVGSMGFVVPAVTCESVTCGEFAYLRLKNYYDEVARAP